MTPRRTPARPPPGASAARARATLSSNSVFARWRSPSESHSSPSSRRIVDSPATRPARRWRASASSRRARASSGRLSARATSPRFWMAMADGLVVAGLPEERQARRQRGSRPLEPARLLHHAPQPEQRPGAAAGRPRAVALAVAPRPIRRRPLEEGLQPADGLLVAAARPPVVGRGHGQFQPLGGVGGQAPLQRGPQVVLLRDELGPAPPPERRRPPQPEGADEGQEVVAVAVAHGGGHGRAAGRHLLLAELAQRLQQPEADGAVWLGLRDHQGGVHQVGQPVEHLRRGAALVPRFARVGPHVLGPLQGEAPGEDGQPGEERLLRTVQQRVNSTPRRPAGSAAGPGRRGSRRPAAGSGRPGGPGSAPPPAPACGPPPAPGPGGARPGAGTAPPPPPRCPR